MMHAQDGKYIIYLYSGRMRSKYTILDCTSSGGLLTAKHNIMDRTRLTVTGVSNVAVAVQIRSGCI